MRLLLPLYNYTCVLHWDNRWIDPSTVNNMLHKMNEYRAADCKKNRSKINQIQKRNKPLHPPQKKKFFHFVPLFNIGNFKHWKKNIKIASQASQPTSHSHRRYPEIFRKKSKLLAL